MITRIYQADWLLPITSEPIARGAIAVHGERLIFVGRQQDLRLQPALADAEVVDFGRAALLPGFVNTHAHLELTVMRGFLEDLPFRQWILKLSRTKYGCLSGEDLQASALLGAAEAIRAGVTTIADTGDSRAPFDALRRSGLRGIAYREVFGPEPEVAAEKLAVLQAQVAEMRQHESARVRVGVSPHAPYTVSAELFRRVVDYARGDGLDIAVHTAESAAEEELLLAGTGEIAEGLAARGIRWRAPGVSTVRYFQSLGVLEAAPLLIHCLRVDDEEIDHLRQTRARVAHCPKSNAKLGHGIAPLARMLDAGVTVGLGTDSVASNNRLDMLGEAQFCALLHRAAARDFQMPTARALLRMMTLDGAAALGEPEVGALEVGRQADVIALRLAGAHHQPLHDVETAIVFSGAASDCLFTMVAGRVLFADDEIRAFDENEPLARLRASCRRIRETGD